MQDIDTTESTQHTNGITEAPKRTRKARATLPAEPKPPSVVSEAKEAIRLLISQRNDCRAFADKLDVEVREAIDSLTRLAGGIAPATSTATSSPRPSGRPATRKVVSKAKAAVAHSEKRAARRSKEDIDEGVGRIVSLLKSSETGLRAEAIRADLGLTAREMPRLLKAAVEQKLCKKSGAKRATVYQAR